MFYNKVFSLHIFAKFSSNNCMFIRTASLSGVCRGTRTPNITKQK